MDNLKKNHIDLFSSIYSDRKLTAESHYSLRNRKQAQQIQRVRRAALIASKETIFHFFLFEFNKTNAGVNKLYNEKQRPGECKIFCICSDDELFCHLRENKMTFGGMALMHPACSSSWNIYRSGVIDFCTLWFTFVNVFQLCSLFLPQYSFIVSIGQYPFG